VAALSGEKITGRQAVAPVAKAGEEAEAVVSGELLDLAGVIESKEEFPCSQQDEGMKWFVPEGHSPVIAKEEADEAAGQFGGDYPPGIGAEEYAVLLET
jgi:hypothetical protein